MNKEINMQFFPQDRRKTRSIEVTPEDIHFLEIDYIDSYYSKKKKRILASNIKYDSNPPTKFEERKKEEKEETKIAQETPKIQEIPVKERESTNIQNNSHTPLDVDRIHIRIESINHFENKNSFVKQIEENKAEETQNLDEIEKSEKHERSIAKKQNLFSVEVASNGESEIIKKPKPPRSRKQINNNGEYHKYNEINEFEIPNGVNDEDKKRNKSNNCNKNENVVQSNSKEKVVLKNFKISQLGKFQDPNSTDKIRMYINRDLKKIYNEFNKFKYLGKKRLLSNEKEEKQVQNLQLRKIEFKFNKDTSTNNQINLKELLKNNLNNEKFKNLYEKLEIFKYLTNLTNNQDNEMYFNNIPNFYDDLIRRDFANSLNFIKVFHEDYAPIHLQKDNEKFFEKIDNINNDENPKPQSDTISISSSTNTDRSLNVTNSKTHFIKKKQSALNIKRQCGVSYVVHTESRQLNVEDKYEKLGHLVYQGTHSIDQLQDDKIVKYIDNIIILELVNNPVLVVAFESPDEVEMKEFLLFPEKRNEIAKEIFILESIDEVWKFSKDKFFFAINLLFDEDKGIRNFTLDEINKYTNSQLLAMSNLHVGILFRKATSGIKSVLKLYKMGGINKILHSSSFKLCNLNEEDPIEKSMEKFSGLNMTTMSMRIELYAPEMNWKNSSQFCKEYFYTFICRLEEKISSLILNWNEYRYTMYLLAKDGKVREYIHSCPYYTLNSPKDNKSSEINSHYQIRNFNLNLNHLNNLKQSELEKVAENKTDLAKSELISNSKIKVHNSFADKLSLINNLNFNSLPNPMYVISTRDCFVFDLIVKSEVFDFQGRQILKKEYFFDENNLPANFYKFQTDENELRVGVVTYENFYSNEELKELEDCVERTEEYSLKDAFLPETAQKTFSGEKIKRTKFFFGSRYMWTKKQLSEPNSYVAAGIRKDVSPPPFWMKEKVEEPLVKAGIILKDFVNSFAMNVYHDGTEGLGQHFDDAVRFKQPIYTLRLFSDCRLSFGSQLYGFCNGAFTIPLPRGCICVMEENSYASNGVKHCIRPCDMTGKSSALILRQMHPNMIREAEKYDFYIDFPCWFSSLSINPNSVPYTQQKAIESDMLVKFHEIERKNINVDNINEKGVKEDIVDVVNSMINSVEYYMDAYVPSMTSHLTKKKRGRAGGKEDY